MSKIWMKHLVEIAALIFVLTLCKGAFAQSEPVPPPPPPTTGDTGGEAPVPPPPADTPADTTKPGEPPSTYDSDKTSAWSKTGDPPPTKEDDETKKKELEELKKRCGELKKAGEELPDECKAADLEVVFDGAVKRKTGPVKALPQAKDTESDSLVNKSITYDKQAQLASERKMDIWSVARREPVLLPETKSKYVTAGVHVGYSWLKGRGSTVERAYNPVIHAAAEVGYQLFPMFQLALVADFEVLKGGSAADKELTPTAYYPDQNQQAPNVTPDREPRDVGAILDNYFGFGIRPTFRVNAELWNIQIMAGVGLGYHFFHTSGRWRTKLPVNDRANLYPIDQQARFNGDDTAVYSFEESDSGIYTVFETTLMYRLMEGKLGVGILFKYTVPIHGVVEPDVKVEENYGVHNNPAYDMSWDGYQAQENDYGDTFIRHLSSLSFITLGLAADLRF